MNAAKLNQARAMSARGWSLRMIAVVLRVCPYELERRIHAAGGWS